MPRTPTRLTARYRAEKATAQRQECGKYSGRDQGAMVVATVKQECRSPTPPRFPDGFCDAFSYVPPSSSSAVVSTRFLRSSVKREAPVQRRSEPIKLEYQVNGEEEEYLPEVPDHVQDDMDILVIGSNPGRMSSRKCQHFGHPSNHFYRALHRAGLTPQQLHPSEDYTMMNQAPPYLSIGLTNLAARPTQLAQQVAKSEYNAGAAILVDLIRKHRPRLGVFIGIGVARAFEQSSVCGPMEAKRGKETEDAGQASITLCVPTDVPIITDSELRVGVGLMLVGVRHKRERDDARPFESSPAYTLLYACPSTSGRVTSHQLPQKADCLSRARILAKWLQRPQQDCSTKTVQIRLI